MPTEITFDTLKNLTDYLLHHLVMVKPEARAKLLMLNDVLMALWVLWDATKDENTANHVDYYGKQYVDFIAKNRLDKKIKR